MVSAKSAGSFLGGIANNPGIIAIAGIGILLLIFRKDISNFFSGGLNQIGETLGNLKFPELPSFEFPTLPSIDIFNLFPGADAVPDIIRDIPLQIPATEEGLQAVATITVERANPLSKAIETARTVLQGSIPVAPSIAETVIVPFEGGGVSFEGGTIFETPIENLSLSQIIDRFMVTASQAANIRAEAIGFTPGEEAFLNQGTVDIGGFISGGPPAVGDPLFEGLTPEEIALRLTGGNISNF